MVEIKIENISKFESKIFVDNLSCSLANALRRIMISEVPTLSIDLVSIEINTSLITDEFLSHRLGLIPLRSTCAKKMKFSRECECDNYCSRCSSIFKLDLKSTNPESSVYSTHLENLKQDGDLLGYSIVPIHDSGSADELSSKSILLAKLKIGQHIKLTCVAKKGIGLEHSKWSPVSVIKLNAEPLFSLNLDKLNQYFNLSQKKKLLEAGKEFLELDEKKAAIVLKKNFQESKTFSKKDIRFLFNFMREKKLSYENVIKLEINISKISFTMETTGALDVIDIFKEAIIVLKRKLNIIGVNLEKLQ